MTTATLDAQLTKYLTDAHSIEEQALIQMRLAPRMAGDERLAAIFSAHLAETRQHARLITERLEARGAAPSRIKDAAGLLTGAGFAAFAAFQPDTPGKLIVHACSYEHMEEATYDLLAKVAERAGDVPVATVAAQIGAQEREMGERVATCFDRAVSLSLAGAGPDDIDQRLTKYLADAHALEGQALELLARGRKLAGSDALATAFQEHRAQTEQHRRTVAERLRVRGGSPNRLKDAALRVGALNWGAFFGAQPDTPAKLAGFAYAFEHLEVGAYEMLKRVAARAGDEETVLAADGILREETAAAGRIRSLFDEALEVTLRGRGLVSA